MSRAFLRRWAAFALDSALLVGLALTGGCRSGKTPTGDREATVAHARERTQGRPTFIRGPSQGNPIAPFIATEVEKSRHDGGKLLVYVGATWCEPCQRFHHAVESGALDGVFPGLRLVEFDIDADRGALQTAGYASRMIPLFAVPQADGRASDRRLEGSIKGEAAINSDLVPRLRSLLSGRG